MTSLSESQYPVCLKYRRQLHVWNWVNPGLTSERVSDQWRALILQNSALPAGCEVALLKNLLLRRISWSRPQLPQVNSSCANCVRQFRTFFFRSPTLCIHREFHEQQRGYVRQLPLPSHGSLIAALAHTNYEYL